MSEAYGEAIDILRLWKEFKEQQPEGTPYGFALWLIRATQTGVDADVLPATAKPAVSPLGWEEETDPEQHTLSGYLADRLARFAKKQDKAPLRRTGLQSYEEFLVLSRLDHLGKATRTKLSRETLLEFPALANMLKRMMAKSWLSERKDPHDRRQLYWQLTSEGKIVLGKARRALAKDGFRMLEPLSPADRAECLRLLLKLEDCHRRASGSNEP